VKRVVVKIEKYAIAKSPENPIVVMSVLGKKTAGLKEQKEQANRKVFHCQKTKNMWAVPMTDAAHMG